MGNSSSQHSQVIPPQWAHTYPHPRAIPPHVKVLPERVPPLRLRTTDNGAILQNGGTISGRKQANGHEEERIHRPRSSSAHRPPRPEDLKLDRNRFGSEPDLRFNARESRETYNDNAVRQRISRSRKKYKAPPAPQNGSGVDSSSPDLNGWDTHAGDCATPGRKVRLFKTRAETNKRNLASSKKPENGDTELSRSSEALNVPRPKLREDVRRQITQNGSGEKRFEANGLKRSASHEVISSRKNLSTPEFQAELLEAAERIRPRSALLEKRESPIGAATDSPKVRPRSRAKNEIHRSRHLESSKENIYRSNKPNPKTSEEKNNKSRSENIERGRAKVEKIPIPEPKKLDKTERDVPSKTFYFGMEENNNDVTDGNKYGCNNNVDKTNAEHRITAVEKSKNLMNMYKSAAEGSQEWDETMEKFAASFHKSPVMLPNGNTTSCSSSFVSDPDEDVDGGIALQLRPTLPKKQLEIPRFSPTAAWRLLSSIDTFCPPAPSPADSDESPVLLEDRIHAPLSQQAHRSSHDKSGDSGISGDASPGGCHESSSEVAVTSSKTIPTQNHKALLMAWTPQQDLEEESSSDDLESPLNSSKNATSNIPGAKFSTRGQLFSTREQAFSMSLPRDERIGLYPENGEAKIKSNVIDHTSRFNSLKKLKAALVTPKRNGTPEESSLPQDSNWLLSRSVPSSLTNGHVAVVRSVSSPSPEQDDDYCQQSMKYPSYSYLATGGRMMYLPEYHSRLSPDPRNKSNVRTCNGLLSKSCENISSTEMRQVGRTPSPVVSQSNDENRFHTEGGRTHQKKKKFTFQSTVRLIENRRLAERLSREAELKENQRLGELEAMKKVEEEFQKKRAREKANIRHQLRLFSLEEKDYSSLPPMEWPETRSEPYSAPTSLPPSSVPTQTQGSRKSSSSRKSSGLGDNNKFTPATQVLSEFREPMRDYRDYRHPRYHDSQEPAPEVSRKSVVEHPRVVYDMPKNTPVYVSAHLGSSAQNQYCDNDQRGGVSTPRSSSSDNYRKDFAHGALPVGGRSLASSDSELSQSHTRPTSRQGVMSHRFSAIQRSRSASPISLRSSSASPLQCLRSSSISPPRSRSASPIRIIINHRSRSSSPNRIVIGIRSGSDSAASEHVSVVECSSPSSVERVLSESPITNEEPSSLESSLEMDADVNVNSQELIRPVPTDALPKIGLTSLQPFNKSGKGYRPISFNPLNNKLAQTVN